MAQAVSPVLDLSSSGPVNGRYHFYATQDEYDALSELIESALYYISLVNEYTSTYGGTAADHTCPELSPLGKAVRALITEAEQPVEPTNPMKRGPL